MSYYLQDSAGDWFHFWDRDTYGEPQFGDFYHARRYSTLAGVTSRKRALVAVGYSVSIRDGDTDAVRLAQHRELHRIA